MIKSRLEFIAALTKPGNYHRFKQVGPRSFVFQDNVDTVMVYVGDNVIIVTGDGPHVITTWNIEQVFDSPDPDNAFWERAIQMVYHKF